MSKTTALNKEISLFDDFNESDESIESVSFFEKKKRPRDFDVATSSCPPLKRKHPLLLAHDKLKDSIVSTDDDEELTSYQKPTFDEDDDSPTVMSGDYLVKMQDLAARLNVEQKKFHEQLVRQEAAGKAQWKALKESGEQKAVMYAIAPCTGKDSLRCRSVFLLTVTDNMSHIPAADDTWFNLNSLTYHDKIIQGLSAWLELPLTSIVKPAIPVSDADHSARLVEQNVINVRFKYVRERSTEKGQAHIHGLLTVYYFHRNGFFPHIELSKARKVVARVGGAELYVNAKHVKNGEDDVLKYMLVPAGEKQQVKKNTKYQKYTSIVA